MMYLFSVYKDEPAVMLSRNPLINAVLEDKVKDLIKEALEVQEDLSPATFAEEREKT